MRYAEYRFECTFETEAMLSRYKGSGLRGLFGHCLRKVACAQRHSECGSCLLNTSCVYFQIFESPKVQGRAAAGNNVKPHPFVLVPPLDTRKTDYAPGEGFEMTFKLFGHVVEWLPYIVFCVEQMGKTGLGARSRQGYGRFQLDRVLYDDRQIYSGETSMLEHGGCEKELDVQKISPVSVKSIEVRFIMPLRLKSRNRLVDSVDFQTLVRACLRRISVLEEAFGDGEPDLDYRGLVQRAADIETNLRNTRWAQVFRYSNRQRKKMNIGGIVGSVQYRGDITPYWPLLKYCEAVHIGKQTAFGHGMMRVRRVEQDG